MLKDMLRCNFFEHRLFDSLCKIETPLITSRLINYQTRALDGNWK
jgi:hypothetical protein